MDRTGRFKVAAEIAAEVSANFELIGGEQRISGVSPATSSFTKFKRLNLSDEPDLPAGIVR
jgi:hypothetical protein